MAVCRWPGYFYHAPRPRHTAPLRPLLRIIFCESARRPNFQYGFSLPRQATRLAATYPTLEKQTMSKPPLELVKANKEQRKAFSGNGQRVIQHDPGKLPEILDECEQALAEADCNLFVQSGRQIGRAHV